MIRAAAKVLMQSVVISAVTAVIAVAANLARSDGIPLVTEVPYEIFAPCRDSEAFTETVTADDLPGADRAGVLYVDARPPEEFARGHREGAVNAPYSPLFGASPESVARVEKAARARSATSVLVYGVYSDPGAPGQTIDLGKPLAQQLIEAGIPGVKHLAEEPVELKIKATDPVKADGGPS